MNYVVLDLDVYGLADGVRVVGIYGPFTKETAEAYAATANEWGVYGRFWEVKPLDGGAPPNPFTYQG